MENSKNLTPAEVHKISMDILHNAEEQRNKSYQEEARFQQRLEFGSYAANAMILVIDHDLMEDDDFFAKYSVTKGKVNMALIQLQIALDRQDYDTRNQAYDFFIEVLDCMP